MRLVPLNLTIISCVCVAVGVSQAQNIDPAEAYDKAVAALDAGDFATGMEVVDSVIDRYKDTGLSRFGPVFGHFYYLRGMLYIRQKKFDEAIEPLKICYEEFGNDKRQEGFPPNLFHVHALVQWASCLQAQEKYSEAIAMFEKALAEDPKREPRINRMGVQMNLGRCYMRTGQEEKGRELLNDVLGLEGLPADAVQDAFTVLAWDSEDANPAQMMQVIQQHAGSLFGSAEDRDVMNPRMASLAVKALNDKDPLGALVWYNLMTAPQEIIDAKMARKEQLLGRKEGASEELAKRIDEAVTAIDEEIATKKDEHANALLGMGAAHYQVRSYSAARAVYQQLLAHFPDLEERAIVLHNLVVIGTKQANWEEASAYGKQFFDEFPSHDFRPAIARILAEVVFLDEDFALAQEMAAEARKGLPAGPEREGLDFVVAASLFQLGQVGPAEAELDSFVKNYQTGQRLESAKFYLASLKVRNGDWPTAAPMLDEYADAYPDSPFRASALHLASLAYLILGNPNEALIRVNTLLGDHRDAPEVPAALNVKGDVQTALGDTYESITTSYLTSRQMVEGQNIGTPETAAYALRQLIALATNAKEYEEAIGYLESFRERYQSTSFNTGATIAALNAFIETDRADEARQLLEGHINELRGGESSAALDETFQAYAAFLRDQFGQDKVIEYLTNFKADSQTPQLSAWLHLGQIETHEASPKPDQAAIDAQFEEINKLYASSGNALSNYALVRLARWRSDTKGDENAAVAIYDFILQNRPEGDAVDFAKIDTAKLDFKSGDAERRRIARQKFDQVLSESTNPQLIEEAVLGVARLLTAEKNYAEAQTWWEQYIEQSGYTLARAEANFGYALCLDQRGQREEALKAYINIYANFIGEVDWSSNASVRAAELLVAKGEAVSGLKVLQDFLRRNTDQAEHPGVVKAKEAFFKMRDDFQANKKK